MNKEALTADQVDEGQVADAIEAQVKFKEEIGSKDIISFLDSQNVWIAMLCIEPLVQVQEVTFQMICVEDYCLNCRRFQLSSESSDCCLYLSQYSIVDCFEPQAIWYFSWTFRSIFLVATRSSSPKWTPAWRTSRCGFYPQQHRYYHRHLLYHRHHHFINIISIALSCALF